MKLLILLGGLVGFVTGIGLGLIRENSLSSVVLHACVVMYLGGLLMRWWGRAWIRGLQFTNEREPQHDKDRLR